MQAWAVGFMLRNVSWWLPSAGARSCRVFALVIASGSLSVAHAADKPRQIVRFGRAVLVEIRNPAKITYYECLVARGKNSDQKTAQILPRYDRCHRVGASIPNTPATEARLARLLIDRLEVEATRKTTHTSSSDIDRDALTVATLLGGATLAGAHWVVGMSPAETLLAALMMAGYAFVSSELIGKYRADLLGQHAQVIRRAGQDHPLAGPSTMIEVASGPGHATTFPVVGWIMEDVIRMSIGYNAYLAALRDALVRVAGERWL